MPLTLLATLSYACTIAVGTASLRGVRIRRVWHTRLFVVTLVFTVVAAAVNAQQNWLAASLLALAIVALALLPVFTAPVRRHAKRHIVVGVSAAPCYLAATMLTIWPRV